MNILIPASEMISKICFPSRVDSKARYVPTVHLVSVTKENKTRLYNTLTGELLELEEDELWEGCKDTLVQHRFLVSEKTDELKYTDSIRELLKATVRKNVVNHFTIFTTTNCNARCFYCYEKGRRQISMSMDTAKSVVSYITHSCLNESEVKLRWFGGEPLLNMVAINVICCGLKEKDIVFTSSMITNGICLTESIIRKAKDDWHLKSVQITLDGTEERYNRIKAFTDGFDNPYRIVMDNIQRCLNENIGVVVRLNINRDNCTEIKKLCDELLLRFARDPKLQIYCAPIRDRNGFVSKEDIKCAQEVEKHLQNLNVFHDSKFGVHLSVNNCMADNDECETILPDGRIGKCEHFSETETIGSIWTSQKDKPAIQSWKEKKKIQKECITCSLYPLCIRLKKCEWEQNDCTEEERDMKIQRLKYCISAFEKSCNEVNDL